MQSRPAHRSGFARLGILVALAVTGAFFLISRSATLTERCTCYGSVRAAAVDTGLVRELGYSALARRDVADALRLTECQRARVRRILARADMTPPGMIGAVVSRGWASGPAVRIAYVQSDSPAQRAGLQPGDAITHVDGRCLKGLTGEDVVYFVRGIPETPVRLMVRRPGEERPVEQTLTRQYLGLDVDGSFLGHFSCGTGRDRMERQAEAEINALLTGAQLRCWNILLGRSELRSPGEGSER